MGDLQLSLRVILSLLPVPRARDQPPPNNSVFDGVDGDAPFRFWTRSINLSNVPVWTQKYVQNGRFRHSSLRKLSTQIPHERTQENLPKTQNLKSKIANHHLAPREIHQHPRLVIRRTSDGGSVSGWSVRPASSWRIHFKKQEDFTRSVGRRLVPRQSRTNHPIQNRHLQTGPKSHHLEKQLRLLSIQTVKESFRTSSRQTPFCSSVSERRRFTVYVPSAISSSDHISGGVRT